MKARGVCKVTGEEGLHVGKIQRLCPVMSAGMDGRKKRNNTTLITRLSSEGIISSEIMTDACAAGSVFWPINREGNSRKLCYLGTVT